MCQRWLLPEPVAILKLEKFYNGQLDTVALDTAAKVYRRELGGVQGD